MSRASGHMPHAGARETAEHAHSILPVHTATSQYTQHHPSPHSILPVHTASSQCTHCILPVCTASSPVCSCIPQPMSWGRGGSWQDCRRPMEGTRSPVLSMPGGSPSPKGAPLPFWESQKGLSWFSPKVWKDTALRACREVSHSPGCDGRCNSSRQEGHRVGCWGAASRLSSTRKPLVWGSG